MKFKFLLLFFVFQLFIESSIAQPSAGERASISDMLETVTPAVINISVTGSAEQASNPLLNDPFFRRFFDVPDQPMRRPIQSAGSGVIIDAENGYILTNHHVVNEADEIEITLPDRRVVSASLIGSDAGTDIALLQVEADNLVEISIADSDTIRVGDFVVAIGNPFGIGQTVTTGIVSALGRSGVNADGYEDFIQTDASINPGNSGGALIDYNGNLIGINTAIITPAGGNVGIGFAIPINMANSIVEQLLEYGEIQRGMLGVSITDLTPDVAELLGLDIDQGAVVSSVVPDSPADLSGIQSGDVIIRLDDEKVLGSSSLRNIVGLLRAGEEVEIELIRDERRKEVEVVISQSKELTEAGVKIESSGVLDGAELSNLSTNHPLYGELEGVLVTQLEQGSRAWRNGLRTGDIITKVNQVAVTKRSDLLEVVSENPGTLILNVIREEQAIFLIMR